MQCKLLELYVNMQRTFTFGMICKCFAARRVLTAMVSKRGNLRDLLIRMSDQRLDDEVSTSMWAAARAMEHQSGSTNIFVSVTTNVFENVTLSYKKYIVKEKGYLDVLHSQYFKN